MKLSDITKLGSLSKDRDYLKSLRDAARNGTFMQVGTHHVRPDIRDRLRAPIVAVIEEEITRTNQKIVDLGVSVD